MTAEYTLEFQNQNVVQEAEEALISLFGELSKRKLYQQIWAKNHKSGDHILAMYCLDGQNVEFRYYPDTKEWVRTFGIVDSDPSKNMGLIVINADGQKISHARLATLVPSGGFFYAFEKEDVQLEPLKNLMTNRGGLTKGDTRIVSFNGWNGLEGKKSQKFVDLLNGKPVWCNEEWKRVDVSHLRASVIRNLEVAGFKVVSTNEIDRELRKCPAYLVKETIETLLRGEGMVYELNCGLQFRVDVHGDFEIVQECICGADHFPDPQEIKQINHEIRKRLADPVMKEIIALEERVKEIDQGIQANRGKIEVPFSWEETEEVYLDDPRKKENDPGFYYSGPKGEHMKCNTSTGEVQPVEDPNTKAFLKVAFENGGKQWEDKLKQERIRKIRDISSQPKELKTTDENQVSIGILYEAPDVCTCGQGRISVREDKDGGYIVERSCAHGPVSKRDKMTEEELKIYLETHKAVKLR